MGIAFLTKKAEKFRQRKDKEFEDQIASGNLFSGLSETVQNLFRCNCTNGELPEVGTPVLLYETGGQIDVILKNKKIGMVMAPDAGELIKMMAHAHTEVFPAVVVGLQALSKSFIVQLNLFQP
jgi:hypothetical protein